MGAMAVPAFGSGQQVLADYEDNGAIDGCYTLADFEEALKLIRPDQQQYGAAVDVIRQAELTNIRRPGGACGGTSADGASGDLPGGASGSGGEVAGELDEGAVPAEDGGMSPLVIGLVVVGALAVLAFVVYLVVSRRGRGGDDSTP